MGTTEENAWIHTLKIFFLASGTPESSSAVCYQSKMWL
jgi:hypothetical protein